MSIQADAEKARMNRLPENVTSIGVDHNMVSNMDCTELKFEISNTLNSSLDLRTTLGHCFEYAHKLLSCEGLSYRNASMNLTMNFGKIGAHKANYRVSTKEETLGELALYRAYRFAEAELACIEMLIGLLFHPLKNALQYHAALESSMVDTLTGLKNRLALSMSAEREIKLAKRHSKAMTMVIIDLDYFKTINDSHGHLAGDTVLKHVATSIMESVRDTDHVFRYGGEEFVILLNEADLDNALVSAERIRKHIENTKIVFDQHSLSITASVGVSSVNAQDSFKSLFERADIALYSAKSRGRNQVAYDKSDRDNQIRRSA